MFPPVIPHTGLMEVDFILFLFRYSHPISQADCPGKSFRALAFMRRKPSTNLSAFPDQPLVFGFIMTHNNSGKIASWLGIQSLQPSRDFVATYHFCYQDNLLYSVILISYSCAWAVCVSQNHQMLSQWWWIIHVDSALFLKTLKSV